MPFLKILDAEERCGRHPKYVPTAALHRYGFFDFDSSDAHGVTGAPYYAQTVGKFNAELGVQTSFFDKSIRRRVRRWTLVTSSCNSWLATMRVTTLQPRIISQIIQRCVHVKVREDGLSEDAMTLEQWLM